MPQGCAPREGGGTMTAKECRVPPPNRPGSGIALQVVAYGLPTSTLNCKVGMSIRPLSPEKESHANRSRPTLLAHVRRGKPRPTLRVGHYPARRRRWRLENNFPDHQPFASKSRSLAYALLR